MQIPLTPTSEVEQLVAAARPLSGGQIPTNLAHRLGATHYDGRYCFTDRPYLLEGCQALYDLGLRVAKLWFGRRLPGYSYNSAWDDHPMASLADVARHPYFVEAFAMPFSTFVLEIHPVHGHSGSRFNDAADFSDDEAQFYELVTYLLQTYAERDVTFILQNWEGDWMIRDYAGQLWDVPPEDTLERCDAMARWFAARQAGVDRARAERPNSRCRVFHAAEVNRVLDSLQGIPTLTTHVLPHVAVDMVSWSCYDGMGSAVDTWHGLDIIEHHARTMPGQKEPVVFIGEIGLPEQGRSQESIVEWWDRAMGVFLARQIPYIIHWELYCNEPVDGNKRDRSVLDAESLRGFWLIRPDGSLSHAATFLTRLLQHAGGRLDGPGSLSV